MITDIVMYGLALLILVLILFVMIKRIEKLAIAEPEKYDKQEPCTETLKEIRSILNESNMHLRSMCRVMDETVKEELGSQIQTKEDIEESNKTSYVEPVKETKESMVKSIAWYKKKIEEFMEEKRKTLDSDVKICNRIGLSQKSLKVYIGTHKAEKEALTLQCKNNSKAELKERFYNRTKVGKGKLNDRR